jgi:hypothetical protein
MSNYSGYNGWKNKETWLVNLWLGDYFASLQEDGEKITADLIESVVEESLGDLSDKSVETGFLRDLLNCALGEIDYRELAAHYSDAVA